MKTATNELLVLDTNTGGVKIAVNGENKWISWDDLRDAAAQSDRDLGDVYVSVLRQAESMAADGPVMVSVHQDHTNVWWVVSVRALHGGGPANWKRMADEGGTHASYGTAASEAEDIVKRFGKRVVRCDF